MKLHPVAAELLAEIEAYRALTGVNKTTFGQRALRDGNFVRRLEGGRAPSLKTIDKVRGFIHRNSRAANVWKA